MKTLLVGLYSDTVWFTQPMIFYFIIDIKKSITKTSINTLKNFTQFCESSWCSLVEQTEENTFYMWPKTMLLFRLLKNIIILHTVQEDII